MASATVSIFAPNAEVVFGKQCEYATVVHQVCIERNQRFSHKLVDDYIQWENATEFTRDVTLYKKVRCFFKQRVLEKSIPIFAKTMTGELIPLQYRPYCDKRNLLEQLEEIDSDLYSFGSTNIIRLVEDSTAPVEEGEIFGIVQSNTFHAVIFNPYNNEIVNVSTEDDGHIIRYYFGIKPNFFLRDNEPLGENTEVVNIEMSYLVDQHTVKCHTSLDKYPIDQLHDAVRGIYAHDDDGQRYYLNEQAQQELVALFHIVRRDF